MQQDVQKIEDKIRKTASRVCHMLELLMAVFVFLGILMAVVALIPQIGEYWMARNEADAFVHFLERVLTIVIGVEFLKMLCRPNADNVLETIIFLVARHMIVGRMTPVDDLISTVSIALLCFLRGYLKERKNHKEQPAKLPDKKSAKKQSL